MKIEFADDRDYDYLVKNDRHITPEMLRRKLQQNEIIVIRDNGQPVGWLRYSYFWDEIPFMNMLYLEEEYRRKGLGTRLVEFWENEMRKKNYDKVLTSSLSNEQAQHFYRKLSYEDCGALLLPDEPLEIIFLKMLI